MKNTRKKWLKNSGKVLALVTLIVNLMACASQPQPSPESVFVPPPPKLTLNEVRAEYISKLQHRGVQIIHVGETVRVVLRDDDLFIATSANLMPSYLDVLRDVTLFMNTYDMADVSVSGYLDNQLAVDVAQSLSTRQAQVVVNKLRYYGIDTRFLYATGYGQQNAVAWNGNAEGRSQNRRVEIQFRYYPQVKRYS